MAEPQSFSQLRAVGRLEKHATARHSLGYYRNVGVSAQYSTLSPMSVTDLPSLMYRSLASVVTEHPSLSAIVVDEDKSSSYFARMPTIDFSRVVRFLVCPDLFKEEIGTAKLDEILEDEHNRSFHPLNGETPLWRLVVVHASSTVSQFLALFIYHHAIADGTSGLAFHRSLLSRLSQENDRSLQVPGSGLGPDQQGDHVFQVPEKPLIPNLESLHPLPLSISYIFNSLWHEYFSGRPSKLWTGAAIRDDGSSQRSRFKSMSFSQANTSKLLRACRSNLTSVTATLHAILAAAVFSQLPLMQYTVLRVDGAVSLRRWMPEKHVKGDSMGTWVSRYLEEHHRRSRNPDSATGAFRYFSWDEARRIRATINVEIDKKGQDSVVGLLKFAGDLHGYFKKKIGKQREESFEFSNIGVFKGGYGGMEKWRIGRVVFSQSADVVGAAFETSLVTGEDGRLNIGFSWMEGVVESTWMDQLMLTYKSFVEEVVADYSP
ncbi:Alcohol acetyltransferase [Cladophialophora chaetospira]|uniref:Alcohol acetyltransferase n=1 Tax=Cladophialophora chaetospira TaxID=386627 RepID=A0AA38X8Z2_9EURO|nr:Alcohol acetyltransferase [Cladophialophora chaetospira]